MKKCCILIMAAIVTAAACQPKVVIPVGEHYSLSENWEFSNGTQKCVAAVPSTIAGALSESGYFGKDLMTAKNYADADKTIFDAPWTCKTEFGVKVEAGKHYSLDFDGLGYYADIYLNGTQIASSDTTFGVFISRKYDVTNLLKGGNKLEVKLRRAQSGDLNIGFVDWNPRPLDESMGIVRPVSIHATGSVSIGDVYVVPELDTDSFAYADLKLRVRLNNLENKVVSGYVKVDLQGLGAASSTITLAPGESKEVLLTPGEMSLLHIEKPRVWWSHDLGNPEMYSLTASFEEDGVLSDKKTVDFGIRKIESRMVGENYRQFTLNGRDILIKGAGWTDDIFLRDTPESIERQVNYVKDMNLNCIRFENIWGKDDTVYDLCDRLGLLAIVGFSCQWEWEDYCGLPEVKGFGCINTPETEDLAVRYFRDQVVRLHNHPAIIGWMTGSDRIANPRLEPRYLEVYAAEDYRPYINSAKNQSSELSGWSGSKMEGPYDYVGPEYWYLDTKNGGAFGFNTETGIGPNIPQLESVRKMIPEDKLWPLSDVWDYHCTASSSCMNTMKTLVNTVEGQYGAATSLEDFMRKAHAVDYVGTRGMFEAFRACLPGTTGIVQWMLNSAWPSIYWQLYDWYGVPTAGYYGTKKACEPEQLLFNYKDRKVYLVSEKLQGRSLVASVRIYDEQSNLIGEEKCNAAAAYRQSSPVFDLSKYDGKPHFVALELYDTNANLVADNFYALPAKDNVYDFRKSNWYVTPITEYADLGFVFSGDAAKVELTVSKADGGYSVTVSNKSGKVAPMVILKAKDAEGNLVVPAFWSDNFFALAPGQAKTVTCKCQEAEVNISAE
ncbi:MAG: glycoside hydrolase family 2 [Bacteroidales bacterium]|nr:glycoside hydrolase family 2 [Bacteroidales bacterium]